MSQQPLSTSAVTINGITIDPNGVKRSRDCQNTNYIYLIPNADPSSDLPVPGFTIDQLHTLEGLGAHVYEYDNGAYLCRYDPPDLAPLRNLDFVDVANCYHKDFKVPQSVQDAINDTPAPAGLTDASGSSDSPPQAPTFTFDLILHPHPSGGGDAANRVVAGLQGIAGVDNNSIQIGPGLVTVKASASSVEAIKQLEEVRTVAQEVPAALFNNVAGIDLHAKGLIHPDSLHRGQGQVVSVNDTGLDLGSTEDIHPDFKGRVRAIIPFSGAPSGEDTHSHGTHVAGSILGSGTSATMGGTIEGTAPGAELVMQKLLDANGGFSAPNNYSLLLQGPYNDHNSRVSSNSWGSVWNNRVKQIPYGESARAISLDRFIWDHQDQVVCLAAGNDGRVKISPAQVSDASAAKNCITVGCTYSSRPTDGNAFDAASTKPSDPTVIANFSSRGPTREGRVKPDITAPGVAILSTCSRSPAISAADKSQFGVSTDPLYMFDTGTSMATPLVSGCCAVLRQMLDANGFTEPSAALVKALLINGALSDGESHKDRSNAKVNPTPTFGFGRVDLENAMVLPTAPGDGGVQDEKEGIKAGGNWLRVTEPITTDKRTIKITLVWTDPPGAAIQRDLYLELRMTYPQNPQLFIPVAKAIQPGGTMNNVQQIIYHDLEVGRRFAVCVRAGTFVPITSTQPFAVVWSLSA